MCRHRDRQISHSPRWTRHSHGSRCDRHLSCTSTGGSVLTSCCAGSHRVNLNLYSSSSVVGEVVCSASVIKWLCCTVVNFVFFCVHFVYICVYLCFCCVYCCLFVFILCIFVFILCIVVFIFCILLCICVYVVYICVYFVYFCVYFV